MIGIYVAQGCSNQTPSRRGARAGSAAIGTGRRDHPGWFRSAGVPPPPRSR
jgi:hypothetical protein